MRFGFQRLLRSIDKEAIVRICLAAALIKMAVQKYDQDQAWYFYVFCKFVGVWDL